jgi:hypothetical protein
MVDLLHGLLLCSGNDAAVAIAEFCAGSTEAFAEIMTQKAVKSVLMKPALPIPMDWMPRIIIPLPMTWPRLPDMP